MDLFILASQAVITDGLWIIVMFLSDSQSDGTHSHAEHPLLRHISTNLMKKQTHPDL